MSSAQQPQLPEPVNSWLGKAVVSIGPFMTVEQGLWLNYCVAVEDAHPLYWQGMKGVSEQPLAPPAFLPSWVVDHDWRPNPDEKPMRTLELHFMLKDALGLPFGVVTEVELEFHRPVVAGDRLRAEQVLVAVGEEYQTRMGPGRRWTIAVNYYHQDEALAGVQTLRFVSYRKEAEL
ncbi:hotdog fold domain-containing protein [Dasania marina]|uniref:hotdog fold domain-containing protein n=1 Tax=Dasania marina TaxID=471499 RepID=UPI000372D1A6|nr:hotdog fold domain-containing protein [Dasania marina]